MCVTFVSNVVIEIDKSGRRMCSAMSFNLHGVATCWATARRLRSGKSTRQINAALAMMMGDVGDGEKCKTYKYSVSGGKSLNQNAF